MWFHVKVHMWSNFTCDFMWKFTCEVISHVISCETSHVKELHMWFHVNLHMWKNFTCDFMGIFTCERIHMWFDVNLHMWKNFTCDYALYSHVKIWKFDHLILFNVFIINIIIIITYYLRIFTEDGSDSSCSI